MASKDQVNSLRVKYLYNSLPHSRVHIFVMDPINLKEHKQGEDIRYERQHIAYCGTDGGKIGHVDGLKPKDQPKVLESDDRPANRPMCPACLDAWRNDPRSTWYKFIHGTGLS